MCNNIETLDLIAASAGQLYNASCIKLNQDALGCIFQSAIKGSQTSTAIFSVLDQRTFKQAQQACERIANGPDASEKA